MRTLIALNKRQSRNEHHFTEMVLPILEQVYKITSMVLNCAITYKCFNFNGGLTKLP